MYYYRADESRIIRCKVEGASGLLNDDSRNCVSRGALFHAALVQLSSRSHVAGADSDIVLVVKIEAWTAVGVSITIVLLRVHEGIQEVVLHGGWVVTERLTPMPQAKVSLGQVHEGMLRVKHQRFRPGSIKASCDWIHIVLVRCRKF